MISGNQFQLCVALPIIRCSKVPVILHHHVVLVCNKELCEKMGKAGIERAKGFDKVG